MVLNNILMSENVTVLSILTLTSAFGIATISFGIGFLLVFQITQITIAEPINFSICF